MNNLQNKKQQDKIIIRRNSGEKDVFNEEKAKISVRDAGATVQISNEIVKKVLPKIKPGTRSEEIYTQIHQNLQKKYPEIAARYSLRRGIMKLGPTGYIFEKYIGRILAAYGYKLRVGEILQGYCIPHEVDVIARKGKKHFMVECKYHNRHGTRSDVQVALYTYSRFKDLEKSWVEIHGHKDMFHQPWLVTNTKCTSQAIAYAKCMNMKILAWKYPKKGSLEQLIEQKGLYPISILPSVSRAAVGKFSEHEIILAKELLGFSVVELQKIGRISASVARKVQKEAEGLEQYKFQDTIAKKKDKNSI